MKIDQLKVQLDNKDDEFEKKLRTMRQEQERIKQNYESKAVKTKESKRIEQLEEEIKNTKNYYMQRIRELSDKNGVKGGKVSGRVPKSGGSSRLEPNQDDLNILREANDRL